MVMAEQAKVENWRIKFALLRYFGTYFPIRDAATAATISTAITPARSQLFVEVLREA